MNYYCISNLLFYVDDLEQLAKQKLDNKLICIMVLLCNIRVRLELQQSNYNTSH